MLQLHQIQQGLPITMITQTCHSYIITNNYTQIQITRRFFKHYFIITATLFEQNVRQVRHELSMFPTISLDGG